MGAPREPSKAVKACGPVQVGHDPLHNQCLLHTPQQPGQPVIFQSWQFPGNSKLKNVTPILSPDSSEVFDTTDVKLRLPSPPGYCKLPSLAWPDLRVSILVSSKWTFFS